ncbi:MAG: phosphoribosylaminoimidazolesuccinocarboxamide synthase [Candidatus Omnitrophica bacterium]|nr:phosphoribosylaminoimidazolesuccinocarboxamide synthase [Candidatus Omnitrophota bacterium]MDD5672347.1 phosphoribosylaminoimidazolesuccinocarboxamide synthase [Candidatus Omnitrophota bacterium]
MLATQKTETVTKVELPLPLVGRGKVRDIFAVGKDKLLIVTTDRLSAFDVVLPNPIPYKGKVLSQISAFWFQLFKDVVPHHLITADVAKMGLDDEIVKKYGAQLKGRSMLVDRAEPLTVECVVRGYVTGSGWKDYQKTQSIGGHQLPAGLLQCAKLPEPIFTPSTKATQGHDLNIDFKQTVERVGKGTAEKIQKLSIELYQKGADYAANRGILIADTKFEFGIRKGRVLLIDEALTPDSSRFWPKAQYQPGHDQPSYDKQIVRNYLLGIQWNQKPPAPELPADVIEKTSQAYLDAFERLTGRKLEN